MCFMQYQQKQLSWSWNLELSSIKVYHSQLPCFIEKQYLCISLYLKWAKFCAIMDYLTQQFSKLELNRKSHKPSKCRTVEKPQKVHVDRSLPNFVQYNVDECDSWEPMKLRKQTARSISLDDNSSEYEEVADLFYETSANLLIEDIQRVQNPYLMFAYLLKKEQITRRFNCTQERKLFHATKEEYVDGILMDNFNWRFNGISRGHKYGKGVSFSTTAQFADNFSEKFKQHSSAKVMFLAYVLVSKGCIGKPDMDVPPDGYDTTKKCNGEVLVKFEDNEFYPAYVIYYHRV